MNNERVFEDFYRWVAKMPQFNFDIEWNGNNVAFFNGDTKVCKFYGKRKMVIHNSHGNVKVLKNWTIMSFQEIVRMIMKYRKNIWGGNSVRSE